MIFIMKNLKTSERDRMNGAVKHLIKERYGHTFWTSGINIANRIDSN